MPGASGPRANDTLTAVTGVRVGHWSDAHARTGCTVVLLPEGGAVTSGLALGTGPGTREYALLDPEKSVQRAHALLLTGGSAFGLDAASGVVRVLEARGEGFASPVARVPIVPAAVLFDLAVGSAHVRPDAEAGAAAAEAAHDGPVEMGAVGVGTGATVGSLHGPDRAVPSGVGSAVLRVGDATVGAVAVSNAGGSLIDPRDGSTVAGRRFTAADAQTAFERATAGTNTTLVVVATDALLDKAGCRALATAAHVGIAHVTRPSHTAYDGDTCFVSATGAAGPAPVGVLGVAVQEVVAEAILRGVRAGSTA